MKRDMDLVRELLLKLESLPVGQETVMLMEEGGSRYVRREFISGNTKGFEIDGRTADEIDYHLALIREANLIECPGDTDFTKRIPFSRLTWSGHDFLDSVRDPEIWAKTKKGAEAAGGFTVDLLKDLAKGFIKKQIEEFTGVKL
jgi:hypothetical protein